MTLFLIFFLTIYSCMHALVFVRLRVLLPNSQPAQLGCALFFTSMIFAPIAVRLLERSGNESLARICAWVGYPWLGFVFLLFCGFLLVSVPDLLFRSMRNVFHIHLPLLNGRIPAMVVLSVALVVSVYGFFEANRIRIERVIIPTAKLPAGIDHLKIAQISDLHLGILMREERLKPILEKIRREAPDILVCTGDLVDGDTARLNGLPELFGQIRPRYGKYAVTGNHEYYAGINQSIAALHAYGFEVLRGEAVQPGNVLNVVGIDDPAIGVKTDEISLLSSVKNGLFTLYLKHRPNVPETGKAMFDLQLSGHTHKGQIFPFSLVTGMVFPMQSGLYDLGNGSKLYVSRGSGTWGPPMRVLSPPEVTVIELKRVGSGP
ncbi:MAG: metallophosphoesterase [Syntrophobacteraceae bacterium]